MTPRIVLDASAAVRVVLRQEGSARWIDLLESASLVIAPSLVCAEVANTLWKYQRRGEISAAEGIRLYQLATSLVDDLIPTEELALEAFSEATRQSHPVYDMLYVVAARRYGCAFLTADNRLASLAAEMNLKVVQ